MNLFDAELTLDDDDPDGYHTWYLRTASLVGAEQAALNVFELPPGQSVCPYHYENAEEEWIVVLTGRVTLRTPEGERELGPWDLAFCPTGEAGAHKVTNNGDEPARILIWSNHVTPSTTIYPDSNKVGAWPPGKLFRIDDAVGYWEGETSADAPPS